MDGTSHFSLGVGDIAANTTKNLLDNDLLFKKGTDVTGTVPEVNPNLTVTAVLDSANAMENFVASLKQIQNLGLESSANLTPSIESVGKRAVELVGSAIAAIIRTIRKILVWVGDKLSITKVGRMYGREKSIAKFYQKRRGTIGAVDLKKGELKSFKKLFSSEISDWVVDVSDKREMLSRITSASAVAGQYIPDFNKNVIATNKALQTLLNNTEETEQDFLTVVEKEPIDSEAISKAREDAEELTFKAEIIPANDVPKFLIAYAEGRIASNESMLAMIKDLHARLDMDANDKLSQGLDKLQKVVINDPSRGISSSTVQILRSRVSALGDIIRIQRRVLNVVNLIHNFDNSVYRAIDASKA